MDDRIHRYLDGELSAEQLTSDEQARLQVMEAVLGSVTARVRAQPVPDLAQRVMAELAPAVRPAVAGSQRAGSAGWRQAVAWVWSPQPIRLNFRPAYAVLVAALLALGAAALLRGPFAGAPRTAAAAPAVFVQFRLEAPGASHVALAGTFTGWQPRHELHETAPGVWAAVVALPPGVHDYTFVVDGTRWVPDPHAPQIPDSFGGTNSRIALLAPHDAV